MVTGLANIRFNNASEESFFSHIEPLTVRYALTVLWLRPATAEVVTPQELVDRLVVWYDASDIATRLDPPRPRRRRRVRPPPDLRVRLADGFSGVRLPRPGGGRLPHPHERARSA